MVPGSAPRPSASLARRPPDAALVWCRVTSHGLSLRLGPSGGYPQAYCTSRFALVKAERRDAPGPRRSARVGHAGGSAPPAPAGWWSLRIHPQAHPRCREQSEGRGETAAMQEHYHEALWVVAGTAAPVIGLALAVVVSDLLGKADPRSGCLIFTLYYACFAVALADFAAMIILLGFSIAKPLGRPASRSGPPR